MYPTNINRQRLSSKQGVFGQTLNTKNDYYNTILMRAVMFKHIDIVKIFLDAGAAVNKKTNWGWTALDYAYDRGYTEIIELLEKYGASRGIDVTR